MLSLPAIAAVIFAICYTIALVLEAVRLAVRFAWQRCAIGFAVAGLVAHTLYLWTRVVATNAAPLSSPAEWLLLAAWVLATVYVATIIYLPRSASGLILMPLILALSGASLLASDEPFAAERASHFWGSIHGTVLLLGTVTVCVGFAAGLMYLLQAYWLKHRRPPSEEIRLPSLEWLEKINTNALAVSTLLIGLGFASGLVLSKLKHQGEAGYALLTDPTVISLAAMTVWLALAEVFRIVYPAARRGRKVAYLTLASFGFLVIALASMLFVDTIHGAAPSPEPFPPHRIGNE